jgi:DUF1680 family protein
MPLEIRWERERQPFISSFCCPPNVVRTLAQLQTMAYSKSEDTIWVNLYGGSEYTTEINGVKVKLTQVTDYPWDGKVLLKVEPEKPVTFTLKMRVPGWVTASEPAATPGTYISQRKEWQMGASVPLNFPMPAQFIESHPAVEENRNQLAVQRGPVVYCLESPEIAGIKLNDVAISPSAKLKATFDSNLLEGVSAIETEIQFRPQGDWNDKLTRPLQQTDGRTIPARLIPVFAWGNRGKSEMSVWLPATR